MVLEVSSRRVASPIQRGIMLDRGYQLTLDETFENQRTLAARLLATGHWKPYTPPAVEDAEPTVVDDGLTDQHRNLLTRLRERGLGIG